MAALVGVDQAEFALIPDAASRRAFADHMDALRGIARGG
jgi:hypothetical protein